MKRSTVSWATAGHWGLSYWSLKQGGYSYKLFIVLAQGTMLSEAATFSITTIRIMGVFAAHSIMIVSISMECC